MFAHGDTDAFFSKILLAISTPPSGFDRHRRLESQPVFYFTESKNYLSFPGKPDQWRAEIARAAEFRYGFDYYGTAINGLQVFKA
jgi:hypothetical protein